MDDKRSFVIRFGFLFTLILILASLIECSVIENDKRTFVPLPDTDTIFLETASSLREVAWKQLTQEEKTTITVDWKKAQVTIVQWEEIPLYKTSVKPESIYKVIFNTTQDELLGPIGIYFDPVTKEIVGYDARK